MPKIPLPVDPKIVFQFAEAFNEATETAFPQYRSAGEEIKASFDWKIKKPRFHISAIPRAIPFAVLDTFTVELYLKSLYVMDRGVTTATHDLLEIYRNLKPRTKRRLRDNYNALASKHEFPPNMPKKIMRTYVSFLAYLRQSRVSFLDVRYAYEQTVKKNLRMQLWKDLRRREEDGSGRNAGMGMSEYTHIA